MNYVKIYDRLVEKAKLRTLTGYVEKHHIIPKCLKGSDDPENIVSLTAKEHFLAHLLLCEIYPENNKLFFAAYAMCQQDKTGSRYRPSSRTYERLKKEFSNRKKRRITFNCSTYGKPNERILSHIRPLENYCNRECYILASKVGKAISKGNIHIYKDNERKFIKIEELAKYPGWSQGRQQLTKKVVRICSTTGTVLEIYNRVTDVKKEGFNPTGVSRCINGHTKTHKGYVWKQEILL